MKGGMGRGGGVMLLNYAYRQNATNIKTNITNNVDQKQTNPQLLSLTISNMQDEDLTAEGRLVARSNAQRLQ